METYFCPVETYAQTRESPAEYCENEVPEEGDLCEIHGGDEPDWDAIRKDRLIDARND